MRFDFQPAANWPAWPESFISLGRDEYIHIDRAAPLEQDCTVALFWDGRLAQMGRLARKPTPHHRYAIDVEEDGRVYRSRMFGPHDKDVEIYRVLRRFVMRDV
jgi:hypothetical protein